MLDKPTPPQGLMNGDASTTEGNRMSLHNRGGGTALRGLHSWSGIAVGTGGVLTLALASIVLVGCNGDKATPTPAPSSTPISNTTSTPSSPSPTPSASPDQVAIAGATDGYKRWVAVQNEVGKSSGASATPAKLASVATGSQLTQDQWMANVYYKQKGRRLITPSTILSIKPTSVGVPNASGVITSITLAVCEDVRKAAGVDKTGKSLVSPNRLPYLNDTVAMSLIGGTWKVKEFSNKPGRSCA
ncbi:hypothetical protein AB0F43_31645 [Kribbella sp. NPDC023972]|uniref:hypothetical protein n=1 Tax=Kribbella sp. NPDC023972 TaxID=3154795 RepID=UPI0034027794